MKKVYGYTRVSTADQEDGVSLGEQKSSIEKYAKNNNSEVIEWFEETRTAAKRGRPLFNQMLKLLQKKKANGVIFHKIDRSTRNLRDWADLGDLIDIGIEVHSSSEAIDLNTVAGRLSGDLHAAFASHYSRNLTTEIKKGLYGQLKLGIYPFGAPVGYLNCGGGELKVVDPLKGSLIKKLFQLYATGEYSIEKLGPLMFKLRLSNRNSKPITRNGISTILHNPFYVGIIKLKVNDMVFQGRHEPIISQSLFDQVQDVLNGKSPKRHCKHDYLYRRCVKCKLCKKSLIAERQKGRVYYRCHTSGCPTKTLREDVLDSVLIGLLDNLVVPDQIMIEIKDHFTSEFNQNNEKSQNQIKGLELEQSQIDLRLKVLNEKLLDQIIDDNSYTQMKTDLLQREASITESIADQRKNTENSAPQVEYLELLKTLKNIYFQEEAVSSAKKRQILKLLTSNLYFSEGKVELATYPVISMLANTSNFEKCGHQRALPRTSSKSKENLSQTKTVNFSVTTIKPGQYKVVQQNKVKLDQRTYCQRLIRVLGNNPDQCHKVIQGVNELIP